MQRLWLLLCDRSLRHSTGTHPNHPEEGPCLALEREGDRLVCGMIRRHGHYMQLPNVWADAQPGGIFAEALGAEKGCDADDPELSLTPRA